MDKLYPIGFVIHVSENIEGNIFLTKTILEYPHIFRKLEWWEERKVEDMPKYVKMDYSIFEGCKLGIEFDKVYRWELGQFTRAFVNKELTQVYSCMNGVSPATESEYTEFIKTKSN